MGVQGGDQIDDWLSYGRMGLVLAYISFMEKVSIYLLSRNNCVLFLSEKGVLNKKNILMSFWSLKILVFMDFLKFYYLPIVGFCFEGRFWPVRICNYRCDHTYRRIAMTGKCKVPRCQSRYSKYLGSKLIFIIFGFI